MSAFDNENDIEAVIAFSSGQLTMKIVMGSQTLEETKALTDHLGRVHVHIGDGLTLLHQAASNNRPDLVSFLCSGGHPLECKTIAGETPLDQACWKGSFEAAAKLIEFGADVDTQTNSGFTPLHRCAFYDHHALAKLLCLAGAKRLKSEDGVTAFEVAVANENDSIAALLKPKYDSDGNDITEEKYAKNNPRHPDFTPEKRADDLKMLTLLYVLTGGRYCDEEEEESEVEGSEEEEEEEKNEEE